MASRKYTQKPIHLLGYYGKEILQKVLRVLQIVFVALLLCGGFCALFAFLFNMWLEPSDQTVTAIDVADLMFRFRIGNDDGTTSFGRNAQFAFFVLGEIAKAVVTGFAFEAIMTPVDLVKFSRFIVLDPSKECMRIRYWANLSEGRYLADASVDVLFELGFSRHLGSSSKSIDYRFVDPADGAGNLESYFGIRGVRFTDVPLFEPCKHGSSDTLWKALVRLYYIDSDESVIRVRIKGLSPNGTNVMYERCYHKCDILINYRFVSIRRDEEELRYLRQHGQKALERLRARDPMPKYVLFMEHLDVVAGVDLPTGTVPSIVALNRMYGKNAPDDVFCLKDRLHVGRFFTLRVGMLDLRAKMHDAVFARRGKGGTEGAKGDL